MRDPVTVVLSGITKRFGGVHALRGVDLTLYGGEVHALLGQNGAGKSTLINVLSGVLTDYTGQITVDGRPTRFTGPAAAQAAGIATIHQELDQVPALSVAENLVLGREPRTRLRTLDRRAMLRTAHTWLAPLGAEIDPRRPVGSLRVGERQLVEIARALSLDARVLIMDEPTAALADAEVRRLLTTIRALRERGVAVVYISHRLEEIEEIADRATVLRDGEVAGTPRPRHTERRQIISLMLGRPTPAADPLPAVDPAPTAAPVDTTVVPAAAAGHPPLLVVENLAVRPSRPGRREPAGISLTVHAGEIVGLAGLLGSGRTELLETLYGTGPPGRRTGRLHLAGRPYAPRGPRCALRAGIGLVPEDRRRSALALDHPVDRSMTLAALRRFTTAGLVRARRERAAVDEQLTALAIRTPSTSTPVGALSGGNQQKVVLARHLLTRPRLLLLDEPTRGVDIGAKAEIHRLLRRLADHGTGILLASSELPELTGLCDRIVVLHRGRTVAQRTASGCTGEEIADLAIGGPGVAGDDR